MRDYAGQGSAATRGRTSGAERDRVMKIIGGLILASLLIGFAGSLWFGMAIRSGLSQLEADRKTRSALRAIHAGLSSEMAALTQQERIERLAAAQGLYRPSGSQLRKP